MSEITTTNGNGNGLKKATWRSRRRMAIVTLSWIIIQTLLLFFVVPDVRIEALTVPITSVYYVMGGIVAGYIGFKAFGKDEMNK